MSSPMKTLSQPSEGWALSPVGQGLRASLLAQLNEACAWVYELRRLIKDTPHTELAFGLYRYLVFGEDEAGAWREFMIEYGYVNPEQLDAFTARFDPVKKVSAERIITACRKTLRTPLMMLSELSSEVLPAVGSKTLAEIIEEGIKEGIDYTKPGISIEAVLDFNRLYDALEKEITMLAMLGLDMDKDRVQSMLECLYEC